MSCAASASADSRRAQIRTLTPSRASARAVSRPMPLLPPVTSAVLLASPRSIRRLLFKTFQLESLKLHARQPSGRTHEVANVGRNPTPGRSHQFSIGSHAYLNEYQRRFAGHRVEDIVRHKTPRKYDMDGKARGKVSLGRKLKCRSLVVRRSDPPALPPL